MRFRRGIGACAVLALTLTLSTVPEAIAPVAPPAQAAAVNASYNVWVWNVAGWVRHRGATNTGLIPVLTDSIRNRGAHFAALNELCLSQYQAVLVDLRDSGWPQDAGNFARFEAHSETACGGQPFGVAIFSKAPLGTANRYALAPDGTSERRKLLCVPLVAWPRLRFCTTHITPSNAVIDGQNVNARQLGEVLAVVEGFHAGGDTVIIAGDFNAQPHYARLDGWYSSTLDVPHNGGNTGAYRELDDTQPGSLGYGETTVSAGNTEGPNGQGKKIDLIFVRQNRIVGAYSGDSLAIATTCGKACSDHRIMIGAVTVSVPT